MALSAAMGYNLALFLARAAGRKAGGGATAERSEPKISPFCPWGMAQTTGSITAGGGI